MDRAACVNVAEKRRLRDAIQEQVRRFLENGGNIQVLDAPAGAPPKAAHDLTWSFNPDLSAHFE